MFSYESQPEGSTFGAASDPRPPVRRLYSAPARGTRPDGDRVHHGRGSGRATRRGLRRAGRAVTQTVRPAAFSVQGSTLGASSSSPVSRRRRRPAPRRVRPRARQRSRREPRDARRRGLLLDGRRRAGRRRRQAAALEALAARAPASAWLHFYLGHLRWADAAAGGGPLPPRGRGLRRRTARRAARCSRAPTSTRCSATGQMRRDAARRRSAPRRAAEASDDPELVARAKVLAGPPPPRDRRRPRTRRSCCWPRRRRPLFPAGVYYAAARLAR